MTLRIHCAPFPSARNALPEGRNPAHVPASLRAILTNLIGYAGLFPPSTLGMRDALKNYANYLHEDLAWVLARFVVPAIRLEEPVGAQCGIGAPRIYKVSCLVGVDADADMRRLKPFLDPRGALVHCLEARAETAEQASRLVSNPPGRMNVYFEVPLDCSLELLTTIRKPGARANIRTGGVTPDAIPPTQVVTSLMAKCAAAATAFKATAGLHLPLRGVHPLTYEAGAPAAKVPGFLNVFLSSALAYRRAPAEQLETVLNLEVPACSRFEEGMVRCGDTTLSTEEIRATRERFAVSFGSCSFEEPIEDLRVLRLL